VTAAGRRVAAAAGAGAVAAAALAARPPRWLVRAAARRCPDVLFRVETERPAVALTLDDGPHPSVTPRVLDVLAAHGAAATLFVLGCAAERHGRLLARAVAEGHELGNHQWRDRPCRSLSLAEFEADLGRTHDVLAEHAPVDLMRPGSGLIRRDQLRVLRERGYRCALGSIYPFDAWLPAGRVLAADVVRRAGPGDVVILHEGRPDRAAVVPMLEALLTGLGTRGLEVTTLADLLSQRGRRGRCRAGARGRR
jgi:peptidoglycan-N-acetylglucosamine deacetylase